MLMVAIHCKTPTLGTSFGSSCASRIKHARNAIPGIQALDQHILTCHSLTLAGRYGKNSMANGYIELAAKPMVGWIRVIVHLVSCQTKPLMLLAVRLISFMLAKVAETLLD